MDIVPTQGVDKRPVYIWAIAILANLFPFISYSGSEFWFFPLFTMIPVWFSGLTFKGRNYIGFGLPILTIAGAIFYALTCTGKFCEILGFIIGIPAAIVLLFFTIGVSLRKLPQIVAISVLVVEIAGLIAYAISQADVSSQGFGF